MTESTGVNVRFDLEELQEVRRAIAGRREDLEKVRSKMENLGLSTFTADTAIETLDRCKVAIGDEPEDMFTGLDKSTGEIKD
ncbi:MAG TPA: hypothetical protein VNA25_02040 [Phycisphaerae bacterium]|nr:hypothetical protein [Phycisphaerae bacterium]